jgi:hypothetical protein
VKTDKDFLKASVSFVGFFLLGGLLFALTSCAGMAHLLGVATSDDLATTVKTVHEVGDAFGPYGSLIATGISAALVGIHEVYRNKTRAKALELANVVTDAKVAGEIPPRA